MSRSERWSAYLHEIEPRFVVVTPWVNYFVRYYTRNEECRCGDCATRYELEWDRSYSGGEPWIAAHIDSGADEDCVDCGRALPSLYGETLDEDGGPNAEE